MLSGLITKESLGEVFRSLSYKRRNGVLEITLDEVVCNVTFREGKIVGMERGGESAVFCVCQRLVRAGCLTEKVLALMAESRANIVQVCDVLAEKGHVSHEEFARAKKSYELDLLHSLANIKSGEIAFTPMLARSEPRLSVSLHPGQLLLDMAELGHDANRFQELFGGADATSMFVVAVSEQCDSLEEHEQIVYDAVHGGLSTKDVMEQTLLSTYDVTQALLTLHEQNLIEVRCQEEVEQLSDSPLPDFDSDGGAEIDEQARATELVREQVVSVLSAEEQVGNVGEVSDFVAEIASQMEEIEGPLFGDLEQDRTENAEACKEVRNRVESPAPQQDSPVGDDPLQEFARLEETVQNEVGSGGVLAESVDQDVSQTEEAPAAASGEKTAVGVLERLRRTQGHRSTAEVMASFIIGVTLIFLLFFAVVGAELLENWFRALSDFTSNS